jgi:hypothetical protein
MLVAARRDAFPTRGNTVQQTTHDLQSTYTLRTDQIGGLGHWDAFVQSSVITQLSGLAAGRARAQSLLKRHAVVATRPADKWSMLNFSTRWLIFVVRSRCGNGYNSRQSFHSAPQVCEASE